MNQRQTERVRYVAGGETRQQSVSNALAVVGDEDMVAVHDAVRPFFTYGTFGATFGQCASMSMHDRTSRVRGSVSRYSL